MNEASRAVVHYFAKAMSGFTFSREEAEYLKTVVIDGAVHDGWERPDDVNLLPSAIRERFGLVAPR